MRIGILGTGDISHEFMKAIAGIDGVLVQAVYQREIKKAEKFSEQYGIPSSFDDYESFLKSCDCVYNGLPNSLHYPFSLEAIKQGKHVIIEKPITSNMAQLNDLIDLSSEQGVKIIEVNRVNFLPHFKFIQKLLSAYQEELFININFCKQSRRYHDYKNGLKPNVFSTAFSGGALYDLGVYGLHFVVALLGKPNDAYYTCKKLESGVDGFGTIVLIYDRGLANINISKITHGKSDVLIQTTQGKIESNTAISLLTELTVDDELVTLQDKDTFAYFLEKALDIIMNQEDDEYLKLLNQSKIVLQLMEDFRKQNAIIFVDDLI